jgi:hypothetical protein
MFLVIKFIKTNLTISVRKIGTDTLLKVTFIFVGVNNQVFNTVKHFAVIIITFFGASNFVKMIFKLNKCGACDVVKDIFSLKY